jgi:DNA-binding HxlR family transcriptional regulator
MDILYHLCQGKKRFGELQRELEGISPKTLSERLDTLEEEKIVMKTVYVEVPLRVEYSLTDRGKALKSIFRDLNTWSKENL